MDSLYKNISDNELIELCKSEINKLIDSSGKSYHLSIPVNYKDTDMLFTELLSRFMKKVNLCVK